VIDILAEALGDVVADADLGVQVNYKRHGEDSWKPITANRLSPPLRVDQFGDLRVASEEWVWLAMAATLGTPPNRHDRIMDETGDIYEVVADKYEYQDPRQSMYRITTKRI